MSKKVILFFIVFILFFSFHQVHAGLIINEIMYSLDGSDSVNSKSREWVEIYNSDANDVSIDASKWRIYDGSANRTINGEVNFSIPSGAYIIFAGDKDTFLTDHSGFSGVVYDTGITSLNNTGATLKILDENGNIVDSVTYTSTQGGAGDGKSLQKISGSWVGAIPTPGKTNESTSTPTDTFGTNSGSVSSSASTGSKVVEQQKIKTKIIHDNLFFAGIPANFNAETTGYNNETLVYGRYVWNFGDGGNEELKLNMGNGLKHIYFYPGEYILTLEYYSSFYTTNPNATDRITIKVIDTPISILRIGDEKDYFVELKNNSEFDIDISNWFLSSNNKTFVFPKNTIVLSNQKMILSPKITNFIFTSDDHFKLFNSTSNLIFEYGNSNQDLNNTPKINIKDNFSLEKKDLFQIKENFSQNLNETDYFDFTRDIKANDLSASAINSDVLNEGNNTYVIVFGFLLLVSLAAVSVYILRRNKETKEEIEDFEILDE